jgi:hypothetical protein
MRQRPYRLIAAPLLLAVVIFLGIGVARAQTATRAGERHVIKLTSQKIDLPLGDRAFNFAGGKEANIANERCLLCHSKGMIDTQPPLPLETWKKEVAKMRSAYGCPLRDDQLDGIATFIQAHQTQTNQTAGTDAKH